MTTTNNSSNTKRSFHKLSSPEVGIYHYRRESEEDKSRLHLRIDPDGQGLLIVNANRVVHLNPSAAQMAYYHLEGFSPRQSKRAIMRQFKVSSAQAESDLADFTWQLEELLKPDGACPV